jgi:ATP-dependent RNA helicase DeaD
MADSQNTEFSELGLRAELVAALSTLGYEEPTPIQREAIPLLLEGHDLLGQAATGTGKTAAFMLPIIHKWAEQPRTQRVTALILVPTRELAMQVAEAAHKYGRTLGVRILPIYGGAPMNRQLRALQQGVDIVVATPGRALDHLRRGTLVLDALQMLVLDEADEMLDMGFAEDIEVILDAVPAERQLILFSATMPPRLGKIAEKHLRGARRIQIAHERVAAGAAPRVRQQAYIVPRAHKLAALGRVLDIEAPGAALIFCRTRTEVDELSEALNGRGYRAEALHGGMSQEQRERVMGRLRSGTAELLIATDVAARGLDVDVLTHVVNYDVPSAPESYIHRIGRVGRAGREGVAITLAEPREHRLLKNIERVAGQKLQIAKVPTVADLHARRLELTRAALREAALGEDLEQFRVVVESLADEFDVMDIALAAVKLAHQELVGAEDAKEIPDLSDKTREPRETFRPRDASAKPRGRAPQGRGGNQPTASIYIGAGRAAGIRPQDLVGAIANEAGLRGNEIGAIRIDERHSLVEVPADVANNVIAALRGTTIKGRKVTVRRDRERE